MLLGEGAHARRDLGQRMPWQLREEMMFYLHLEASMEPRAAPVACQVARGKQLELKEAKLGFLLGRELVRHKVAHKQLHVQDPDDRVVDEGEEEAGLPAGQDGKQRNVPAEVEGEGEDVGCRVVLHSRGDGEGEEVESANDDREGEPRHMLDAHECSGDVPDGLPQEYGEPCGLTPPEGHLLERLQPEWEVHELRVGVRPQRVRVVHVVLSQPHLAGDAEQHATVETKEGASGSGDTLLRDEAVVRDVMGHERCLLQRDAKERWGHKVVEQRVRGQSEQAEQRGGEEAKDDELPAHEVRVAWDEGALSPQLAAKLAIFESRSRGCRPALVEFADAEAAELVCDSRGVEELELVGGVLARVVHDDGPARVEMMPARDVVHVTVHRDPAVSVLFVRGELLVRNDAGLRRGLGLREGPAADGEGRLGGRWRGRAEGLLREEGLAEHHEGEQRGDASADSDAQVGSDVPGSEGEARGANSLEARAERVRDPMLVCGGVDEPLLEQPAEPLGRLARDEEAAADIDACAE
mmetsp:Transcript_5556/g.11605  ORF Transcript_5556/g.11605 Transcript_5556/m.11605 type:complete len:524 (+) Transcript_5556:396-1967(+)